MSNIDITKPVTGLPTTQSVRDNFAAAASEIDQNTADIAALKSGGGPGGGIPNDYFSMLGYRQKVIVGGPMTFVGNGQISNQMFGFATYQDSGTDGDEVEFIAKNMEAGNYLLHIHFVKFPSSGITETYMEGNLVDTIDEYSLTTATFFQRIIAITLPAGDTVFRRKTNGKNPASSGYYSNVTMVELIQQ